MGIDMRAVLAVGVTYGELTDEQKAQIEEYGEVDGMNSFSPYFDADSEDHIYGLLVIQSNDYSARQILDDLDPKIREAKEALLTKFGLVGRTYLVPYVW